MFSQIQSYWQHIGVKNLLDQIVSKGILRSHIKCIQPFQTGQVDITFSRKEDQDLFWSKAAVVINQCQISTRPLWESGVFVKVYDAPVGIGRWDPG